MKKTLLLVTLLSCIIQTASAWAEQDITTLASVIRPAVVTVINYNYKGKPESMGSGFFINKRGHLITNYHVYNGKKRGEIKTIDGKTYPITSIISQNPEMDLVKLKVAIPAKEIKYIRVSRNPPSVAEKIMVVGSPLGLEQTVSDGILSAKRNINKFGIVYQITAPISPGSSGSPVVNMNGQVIGVVSFQAIQGQNLNFAIPAKHVADLSSQGESKVRIFKDKKGTIVITDH